LWTPRGLSTELYGRRRRTQPPVPVQTRLQLFLGQVAPATRPAHPDGDLLDVADPPAANELARFAEFPEDAGTLLAARLENALVLVDRLDAVFRFQDRQRQRLLAIHVLARLAGFDDRDRVPEVRRGDADRIQVLTRQQFAEIVRLVAALVGRVAAVRRLDAVLGVFAASAIDFADGQHLHVRHPQQGRKMVVVRHLATADHGHRDPFARRRSLVVAQHARRHNHRRRRRHRLTEPAS
jgi:hypothetical protein